MIFEKSLISLPMNCSNITPLKGSNFGLSRSSPTTIVITSMQIHHTIELNPISYFDIMIIDSRGDPSKTCFWNSLQIFAYEKRNWTQDWNGGHNLCINTYRIFNNYNPSQVFAQAKANATSIQIASPYAFEPAWILSRKFNNKAQYTFQCKDRL